MLQNLQWDSFQQRRARSRVLILYRIQNGLVAIRASTYPLPATVCTRGFETKYQQIQYTVLGSNLLQVMPLQ